MHAKMKFICCILCLLITTTFATDDANNKGRDDDWHAHTLDALKLYGLQFEFGGVTFEPSLVKDNVCPEEWPPVAQCIMKRCSNFIASTNYSEKRQFLC